jgi:hypothetical protein
MVRGDAVGAGEGAAVTGDTLGAMVRVAVRLRVMGASCDHSTSREAVVMVRVGGTTSPLLLSPTPVLVRVMVTVMRAGTPASVTITTTDDDDGEDNDDDDDNDDDSDGDGDDVATVYPSPTLRDSVSPRPSVKLLYRVNTIWITTSLPICAHIRMSNGCGVRA